MSQDLHPLKEEKGQGLDLTKRKEEGEKMKSARKEVRVEKKERAHLQNERKDLET